MFDTVVLGRTCPKDDFERYSPFMRLRLFEAQRACIENGIPLLITVTGVDMSGRGPVMNFLSEWMDGKFMRNHVFWLASEDEAERPLEWRYWRCLPGKGETAVFFDGWYGSNIRKCCCGELDEKTFLARMHEFKGLEESLALSGMAIVKIWLHLDRKTHDKRLKHRLEHKTLRHFAPYDKKVSGNYDALVRVAADAITMTDRTYAPWAIIDAADENFRNLAVAKAIVDTVDRVLDARARTERACDEGGTLPSPGGPDGTGRGGEQAAQAQAVPQDEGGGEPAQAAEAAGGDPGRTGAPAGGEPVQATEAAGEDPGRTGAPAGEAPDREAGRLYDPANMPDDLLKPGEHVLLSVPRVGFLRDMPLTTLEAIDLSPTIDSDSYKKQLRELQAELQDLTYHAYRHGISSTLIFEGMDAAGKGGAIRRLLQGVDARICRVIPISSPTDEELAHHYLWRFWRHIPRYGFVTIYDRSWYGRVLVERVENLTPRSDWSRAYAEINHFEAQLTDRGNILIKYWLHISSEEELRRFRERENTPWKRYKITPDDWRNRSRWDQYLVAADEMFLRTSTSYAPWHIIPAEDKKYARIEVLKRWRDALKKALAHRKGEKHL